jgi:hypothetical protein
VTGEIEFPSVRPAPGDEPLLRNVSLSEVSILNAARVVPGTWARVVVDSDGAPLLMAGVREGRRIVVLAFALQRSDLPLQVAFPLLLSNIMNFLAPDTGVEASQIAPGEPLALRIDPAITDVRLTRPDGERTTLDVQDDQVVYADTQQPGVYILEEFRGDDLEARHRYAVNVFSPRESQVAPQQELAVSQSSGLQAAVTQERAGRQEFWRWLAGFALLILVVEWMVYQRSGITYLRDRWLKRGPDKRVPRAR